jgi:Ca2+-binding EF-hand superfamily protein
MKKILFILGLTVIGVNAQDADKSADKRPQNPIIAALDANHDGEIDANEINNAPAALRKLDKNGDGKVSRAEMRAQRDADSNGDKPKKEKKKKKNL